MLPPYPMTGFDLATRELQSPRWQAETIPLDLADIQGNGLTLALRLTADSQNVEKTLNIKF
jgi:hypothetical protein